MIEWILENTVIACTLALLVRLISPSLRSRPALCHALWVMVLVTLVAPPLPNGGLSMRHRLRDATTSILVAQPRPTELPPTVDPEAVAPDDAEEGSPKENVGTGPGEEDKNKKEHQEQHGPILLYADGSDRPTFTEAQHAGLINDDSRPLFTGAIAAIWIAGALTLLIVQVRRARRFHALVRLAAPASDPLLEMVGEISSRMGLRRPRVRVLPGLGSPLVWSAGRPVILWPAEIDVDNCARGIVAHELAHLKRGDHLLAWFELATSCVCWWHPLYWYVRRQAREYAELSCDAWVVWLLPDERRSYAEALIDTTRRAASAPGTALAFGAPNNSRRNFERRLRMVMHGRASRRLSPVAGLAVCLTTLVMLPAWTGATSTEPAISDELTAGIDSSLDSAVRKAVLRERAGRFDAGKDWRGAADAWSELTALDKKNAHAWERLGYALAAQERYRDAYDAFAQQVKLGHEIKRAEYNLGCLKALSGYPDGAFEHLGRAVNAGYLEVEPMWNDDDLESVREDARFEKLTDRMEKTYSLAGKGQEALEAQDWNKAASIYAKLSKEMPTAGWPQHFLSYSRIMAGEYEAALASLERQIEIGFRPATGYYNTACAYALTGQTNKAIKAFKKSIKSGFDDRELIATDSDLDSLRDDPRFDAIVAMLDSGDAERRQAEDAWNSDWQTVSDACDEIVESCDEADEDHAWALTNRGVARFYQGDYEGAKVAFMAQVQADENVADGLYNIACCYSKLGQPKLAMSYLRAAVATGDVDAAHMRNDHDLAAVHKLASFDKLAREAEDEATLRNFNAVSWAHLKDRSEATLELEPDNGRAYHQLGWALLRLDRPDQAIKAFRKQDENGFAPVIARYNVACSYAILDERDAAIEWLERAVDAGFDDAEFARNDPDLASLHGDKRFKQVLGSMKTDKSEKDHSESHGKSHKKSHEKKSDSDKQKSDKKKYDDQT